MREALFRHHRVIYGAFDYYATLYSEEAISEVDVWNLTFNAYLAFCSTCKIATRECATRDLETIWVLVNAKDRGELKSLDKHNAERMLNRQEFLQCLVRIAIDRSVKPGKIKDVSQAVEQLLIHISERLPPEALQNSNMFRKRYCYIEQTSNVYERAYKSVVSLYSRCTRHAVFTPQPAANPSRERTA